MNDMSQVIVAKSDQLNADDLISGPRTIRITGVSINNSGEQPVAISFEGDNGKPWKPCKTMSRVLVGAWKSDAKKYVGKSLTLYRDPNVTWGGMKVGGIRISHMSDIDHELTMALMASNKKKGIVTIRPLQDAPAPADKVADGVRALLARIAAADEAGLIEIMAEPAVAKQRAWLAKNRPELSAEVDRAVDAANAPFEEGPADSDRGELIPLAEAIDQVQRQTSVADVDRLVNSLVPGFDDAEADSLRAAAAEVCERLVRGE